MLKYEIYRTDSFSYCLKKYKKNKRLLIELKKKVKRLEENPNAVGGYLSGKLFGKKSTRLVGKFRLIFNVNEEEKRVDLIALDHRKFSYEFL